jgi:hypothetical protein
MKRQPLTFTVHTTEVSDSGEHVWEKTRRYSRMRHLIITRAINEAGYAVTHVLSGKRLGKRYPKLSQARAALPLLLPLADWRLEAEEYFHDGLLRDKVAEVHAELTA